METGSNRLWARCRELVEELGLGSGADVRAVRPLTGGVASDIVVVDLAGAEICLKFARAKLQVEQDWFAPVHRNRAEYEWLRFAGRVVPTAAPNLYGCSNAANGFAMEFISGSDVYLWKTALFEGQPGLGEAAAVADALARIHEASARPDFHTDSFENQDDFHALRLEPYLVATSARHPDLAVQMGKMIDNLYHARTALVHGDVSPKNILFRNDAPVFLDAECATMGDPAFDIAFCLNHLILKAVRFPQSRNRYLDAVAYFRQSYQIHVSWEPFERLDARVANLLPALMLARVDGKSPVEYLRADEQAFVRTISRGLIQAPPATLEELIARLKIALGE